MISSLLNLLFPPLCLHCDSLLLSSQRLFCDGCSGFFELIDPSSRCCYCFCENNSRSCCKECLQKKRWDVKMGSALDYLGAVKTLVKKIKYGHLPYLAKTGAAFMIAQLDRLGWPLPDIIVPVPKRNWFQGVNHASLIGRDLSLKLGRPLSPIVKREPGAFSQSRLTKWQRERLSQSDFFLKNKGKIENKTILLVDDVITTGTTIIHCAEALKGASPAQIFGLSLARAPQ